MTSELTGVRSGFSSVKVVSKLFSPCSSLSTEGLKGGITWRFIRRSQSRDLKKGSCLICCGRGVCEKHCWNF